MVTMLLLGLGADILNARNEVSNQVQQFHDEVVRNESEGDDPDPWKLLDQSDARDTAIKLHKQAEKGHVYAMFNLGIGYMNGYGVNQDKAKAIEWFRRAADKGFAGAKAELERLEKE